MPGLVYTFVARGTTVLAEYAAISGNFKTVGIECLQNAQMQEDKFVVTADQYTFNYLVQQGYSECHLLYCCSTRCRCYSYEAQCTLKA
jgi:vesicle-associated membrane protein 72